MNSGNPGLDKLLKHKKILRKRCDKKPGIKCVRKNLIRSRKRLDA
jgi:hypothetical protein